MKSLFTFFFILKTGKLTSLKERLGYCTIT